MIDIDNFKVTEDDFGNLTLKFAKKSTYKKGDNIFVFTEFKERDKKAKLELLEEIKKKLIICRKNTPWKENINSYSGYLRRFINKKITNLKGEQK